MHRPVFELEAIEALHVEAGKRFIDATLGEAGHSKRMVAAGAMVLGIDVDPEQAAKHVNMAGLTVAVGNFGSIQDIAKKHGFDSVDGILVDLGLSMEQLTKSGKGLSFKALDDKLDMRLSGEGMSASDFLNRASLEELTHELMKYSEDLRAKEIAKEIYLARLQKPLVTVADLIASIDRGAHGNEKTYARIFQAVRIIVNRELEMIEILLTEGMNLLRKGGRMVIISFHSLEDRKIKQFARTHRDTIAHTRIDVEKKRALYAFERSATIRVLEKL